MADLTDDQLIEALIARLAAKKPLPSPPPKGPLADEFLFKSTDAKDLAQTLGVFLGQLRNALRADEPISPELIPPYDAAQDDAGFFAQIDRWAVDRKLMAPTTTPTPPTGGSSSGSVFTAANIVTPRNMGLTGTTVAVASATVDGGQGAILTNLVFPANGVSEVEMTLETASTGVLGLANVAEAPAGPSAITHGVSAFQGKLGTITSGQDNFNPIDIPLNTRVFLRQGLDGTVHTIFTEYLTPGATERLVRRKDPSGGVAKRVVFFSDNVNRPLNDVTSTGTVTA